MQKILSLTVAVLMVTGSTLFGATLTVSPGQSIQAKINEAQPGDIIAIFSGLYTESLTINKAVRLVEVSGQEVILHGNITFDGVTDAPPFENFTHGAPGTKITIHNTTGLLLRNIDARTGDGINSTGTSNPRLVNCQSSQITGGAAGMELVQCSTTGRLKQTSGSMNILRCTVGEHVETLTTAQTTVIFRTTATDVLLRAKKTWVGYSDARHIGYYDQVQGKVVVVGCIIDRRNEEADGLYFSGTSNDVTVANTIVKNVRWGGGGDGVWGGENENALWGGGSANTYLIANNYFHLAYGGNGNANGAGVRLHSYAKAEVLNNIIEGASSGIVAPFGVVAQNNLYFNVHNGGADRDGVSSTGKIIGNPLFVTGQAPTLATNSPCLNAGVANPIYNNRDGTRNTIGPSGGSLYDPNARTTENPVIIAFDLGPQYVVHGQPSLNVTLSNGKAVSQP